MLLTSTQMLARWKTALGLDVSAYGATVERMDGIDLDARLTAAMREWYLAALDTAPLSQLCLTDLAADLADSLIASEPHACTYAIPDTWHRIASVRLSSWRVPVAPVTDPAGAAALLERIASPFSAPGPVSPAAILLPGRLICAPAGDPVEILAVVDHGPDAYELRETLLATIPTQTDILDYE